MVDPSLFTIPYDCELVHALRGVGSKVTLYGRPLRNGEALSRSVSVVKCFYGLSEWLPKAVRKPIKGGEHVFDMSLFVARMMLSPPQIIHFQWCPLPKVDARAISLLRHVAPVVLTVHDPNPYNGFDHGMMNSGSAKLPAYVDAAVVHSDNGKAQLIRNGVPQHKIHVIPHGPLPVRKSERVVPPGDRFNIVFFGKIKPYKGLDTLVAAMVELPPNLKQRARLIVAGEAVMDISEIRAMAERAGVSILWELRFIPDGEIDFWLRQADLFVFPYRDIDASGVLMSCLGYSKPVVAARIGTFGEILKDQVHGYLIDRDEPPRAFTDAIHRIMTDTARAELMGAAVGRLTDRLPAWNDIALSTMKMYGGLRERWCTAEGSASRVVG